MKIEKDTMARTAGRLINQSVQIGELILDCYENQQAEELERRYYLRLFTLAQQAEQLLRDITLEISLSPG